MTAQAVHRVDVLVAFLTLAGWASLLILLEKVPDPRVRWARLASFGPLHQAYDRLPATWGALHGLLVVAALLWLGATLVRTSRLRAGLVLATAACLMLLATAWALATPTRSQTSTQKRGLWVDAALTLDRFELKTRVSLRRGKGPDSWRPPFC